MATLTNTKIKDTYPALLKASDNGVIGATEKVITDGLGNDSVLKLGTSSASFTSDIEVNSLTIGKGSGSIATNTAIGSGALADNTTGGSNVAVGLNALNSNTTSSNTTAIGRSAMANATGGNNNTAVGFYSLVENQGTANVAVGDYALGYNTTGGYNTALGSNSLRNNTTGAFNSALGKDALNANTTGQNNVAVGHNSGALNTVGNSNTSLGSNSLYSNTASGNTAVGSYSLNANTSATQNTAVGADALRENTASSNTAVGHSSLGLNTTGAYNTGVGVSALYANQTGGNNTALGYLSLRNNTADYNTAVGSGSLYDNTSGTFNVALGYNSLYNNTTGNNNTAVGVDSLRNNTTGVNNTALGLHALRSNTEGNHNTSIGAYSLDVNTVGLRNTSVGYSALSSNTEGDDNTAVGYNSLVANTTGLNNVAIGKDALKDNTTGGSNTSIGTSAIAFLNGTDNVAIGQSAGANTTGALPKTAGSQNTYVGAGIRSGAADTTNEIVIGYNTFGNGSNTATYGNASIDEHHFGGSNIKFVANGLIGDIFLGTGLTSINNHTANGNLGLWADDGNQVLIGKRVGSSSYATNLVIDTSTGLTEVTNGNFAVDTNTLYVDAANNAVGVGTTSVTGTYGKLSVAGGMRILDDSNAKLEIGRYSAAASNSYIKMGANSNSLRFTDHNDQFDLVTIQNDGNVGIGVTPSAWSLGGLTALQIRNGGLYGFDLNEVGVTANAYYNGGYKYISSDSASMYLQDTNSNHIFRHAASGTAGAAITWSESMRIDSSGNVGIGTSSPASFTGFTVLSIGSGTNGGILNIQKAGTSYANISADNNNLTLDAVVNTQSIVFRTGVGTAERMRIDSSGTTTMIKSSAGSATTPLVLRNSGSASVNTETKLYLSTVSGDNRGCYISSKITSTSNDNALILATNSAGSDATERMRITSGGDVRTFGSSDALYLSHSGAAGTSLNLILGKHSATGTGTGTTSFVVRTNGDVLNTNNSYGAISDAKLKENVTDASPKLDDLLQVKIRNFNYIGDDKKQLGVVAQELEEVFPSMIDESPDFEEQEVIDEEGNVTKERVDLGTTTKSVKYSVFVPMLIKAMQEQQEIINDLKARIETLEAK